MSCERSISHRSSVRFGTVGVFDGLQVIESKGRALNSAVECHLHTVEVIGSNPIAPTIPPRIRRGAILLSPKVIEVRLPRFQPAQEPSPLTKPFLCEPSCPLWFKHLHFINQKGHEGTQRKEGLPSNQ